MKSFCQDTILGRNISPKLRRQLGSMSDQTDQSLQGANLWIDHDRYQRHKS
jgi:hypothetical protein